MGIMVDARDHVTINFFFAFVLNLFIYFNK